MAAIEKSKRKKPSEVDDDLPSSLTSEKKKMRKKTNHSSPRPHPFNKSKKLDKKIKKNRNPNFVPLGENKLLADMMRKEEEGEVAKVKEEEEKGMKRKKKKKEEEEGKEEGKKDDTWLISTAPAAQQLRFFLERFQSANKIKLSPLELEAFKDTCMVELAEGREQDVDNLGEHMKALFGSAWKEQLTEGKLSEGLINEGSPALLIVSASALSSLDLLRGLKSLTRECRPAKLFAKHMKVEEQVTLLKSRVNIASGTPSRIKKLLDMEALSLSRSSFIVLDMRRDMKGYSLFTLPQVSDEFWDLYKSHLQPRLLQGDTRICFYGAVPREERRRKCVKS